MCTRVISFFILVLIYIAPVRINHQCCRKGWWWWKAAVPRVWFIVKDSIGLQFLTTGDFAFAPDAKPSSSRVQIEEPCMHVFLFYLFFIFFFFLFALMPQSTESISLSLSLSLSQSIYSPLHCFFSNGVALRKRSIWITISLELIDINWFWHWFERIDFESIKILLFLGNKINIQSIWKQFP